jgi:class 3 adenylate cyclase
MSGDGAQHGSAADHRGPALPDAQTHPLALTLQRDGGSLLQGLTDMRAAGRLARVEVPDAALKEVRAAANADAHALGSRIFSAFLAAPIRDLLVTSAERPLYLQIDEQLMDCPWELAYDGTRFLGEKFAVARQIVLRQPVSGARYAPPVRDLLKVLLVVAEAEAARAQALQHHLDALPGVRVRTVDAGVVTSAGTLDALAGNHVVHWLGKEALAAAEIAVLRAPPEVIVLETGGGGAARASTLAGLNVVMTHAAPAEAELAFIERMYAELAAGEALGEAVRRARAVASARNDIAGLSAALYGDPLQALVSRTHALPEQDNRRQVTVLSCDIVGSTSLLKNLGAEAYSDLLHRYRTICASVVSHQGGYIEESKGDGILALFGFPVAHEDGAARALRAGEEIIAAVGDLDIAVRMGVATGPVAVAGGMPVGDVIHFTIRLQTNAAPNALLVSDTTRRIVGERFVLQPITAKLDLKGFDSPGPVYRLVAGGRAAESLESGARLTPFVGRSTELRYLERHWAAARTGSPRAILVSGDAGIGKSRLVREFTRAQAARRYQLIVCRCTPDHVASAFHPVIDFLRHTLDLDRDDSIEQKHESVRQAMAGSGIAGAATLIAALLSLPPRGEDPAQRVSAEKQRDQTLEALAGWVVREAAKGPLCVLIEDIHWIDPSTRELLVRLDRRAERLPLMIVATVRTEHRQPTILPGEVEEIELKGLSEDAAREMVVAASGDARLPRDVVGFLAQKADGVPLFIEESTRMMLDTRAGAEAAVLSALPFTVPATIHDVLMARLDRLSAAKPLAQLGGTIGREFSLSLIESVLEHPSSPIRVENLPARIDQLVESGLLVRKGDTAGANYAFKHALVRDAAYESLWERDRRRLHWTIATVLKERFGEQAETQPEVLAYHYTQAGTHTEAIAHWERAARRAASRSAHKEAISHLEEGLKLVAGMQSPGERDRLELRFQLLMAARLIATEGYGAERVERVYSRASELCSAVGDENSLLKVRLGLEGYHFMRADF